LPEVGAQVEEVGAGVVEEEVLGPAALVRSKVAVMAYHPVVEEPAGVVLELAPEVRLVELGLEPVRVQEVLLVEVEPASLEHLQLEVELNHPRPLHKLSTQQPPTLERTTCLDPSGDPRVSALCTILTRKRRFEHHGQQDTHPATGSPEPVLVVRDELA